MNTKIKTALIATLAALAIGLSGCNTVQGVGQDIESAGKKAEEAIKK